MAPVPKAAAAREAFIGDIYSRFFSTVNLVGLRAADVRGVARHQVPRRRQGAVHSSHRGAVRIPADAARAVDDDDGVPEGGGQQPRLLARQHHQAGAVAADQPRSEVQGQAGGRFVLRARRRCAAGRPRLRRRAARLRGARVREHQRGPGRRLARRRRAAQSADARQGEDARRRRTSPARVSG